jgi:hypothetical protein
MSKEPEPSLLRGHAQYIKGQVEETIGTVSGKQDKGEAVATMKVSCTRSGDADTAGR